MSTVIAICDFIQAEFQKQGREFVKCIERRTDAGNVYLEIISRPVRAQ